MSKWFIKTKNQREQEREREKKGGGGRRGEGPSTFDQTAYSGAGTD